MNAQDILHYILIHSEMLIGVCVALAIVITIFILVLPSHDKQNATDLSGLEETLKRVIEKIPQGPVAQAPAATKLASIQDDEEVPHAAPAAAPANPGPSVDPAVLNGLKSTVTEREKRI